ncbi:MAG: methionyl-tRNA formyltransferase [Rhodospirillaceae bacterium]|nr:methionyl-tRNA formyltransferase [Rhodospirillaceae bacterium]MDE0362114.1 methionyl-tRNA formyltransferase [Rhodospirillaceae bacterium]
MPQIAFAGTPDFAVPCLSLLLASGCEISLVLTQPDRPSGRGRRATRSPVKREALEHGLDVRQPLRLDGIAVPEDWGGAPDLLVVAAYGLLIPHWLLDWPRAGAVNVHASLLPRWRGAAPIQYAILAGDTETGASIMKMDAGLDTGPVYRRRKLAIEAGETAGMLHDRLARCGAELLVETLPGILNGALEAEPQDDALATHAPRIAKSDGVLDWTAPAVELERRVRAFNPWPVAETRIRNGGRVRIWEAVALERLSPERPGAVICTGADGVDVATGAGILRVRSLQRPGGRAMSAADYVNANPLEGETFGG